MPVKCHTTKMLTLLKSDQKETYKNDGGKKTNQMWTGRLWYIAHKEHWTTPRFISLCNEVWTHNFKLTWYAALLPLLMWSVTFDQKVYPCSTWGALFWTTQWRFPMHFHQKNISLFHQCFLHDLESAIDVTIVHCLSQSKLQLWHHQISLRKRHWLWLPRSVLSLEIYEFAKEKNMHWY